MVRRIFSDARRDQRGFSLAELLVAMAILGLIMTGILTLLMTGNESYLAGANQVEAQAAARVALERMAEEIRGAGYNPQNVTTWNPIVASGACPDLVGNPPTATAFMIQGDGNGDGAIGATECVLYQLTGTRLQRRDFSVDASPQDVIGGVQALTFTYWRSDGTQISPVTAAEVPNIRSVQIAITTQPESPPSTWTAGNVRVGMTVMVRLRNRF